MGGDITGYIQENDTHAHFPLNRKHQNFEGGLMLSLLQKD